MMSRPLQNHQTLVMHEVMPWSDPYIARLIKRIERHARAIRAADKVSLRHDAAQQPLLGPRAEVAPPLRELPGQRFTLPPHPRPGTSQE